MTRTIERDVRIEHGRIVIDLPADIPDGPAHGIFTLEATPRTRPSRGAAWIADLEPISPGGWPPESTLSRAEIYDDGR